MATPISQPRWYTIGPHGFYDLVRLARCGRSTLVRVSYVLALFAALAIVYYNDEGRSRRVFNSRKLLPGEQRIESNQRRIESINANARIAERFSITILVIQNIAVLILMPIYIAASVFEERDKRMLPLLFTTDLTAREIVLGKCVSRVGHVGGVLLGGLPVLSFVQLWGGIDMPMIAANFCNTALWLVSVAAFSMMAATQSRTMFRAVVKTYLILAGTLLIVVSCLCGPLEFRGGSFFLLLPLGGEDGYWWMGLILGVLAIFHLALANALLRRATNNLERQRGDEPMPPESLIDEMDDLSALSRASRVIPDNALLWKEQRHASQLFLFVLPVLTLPFFICLSLIHFTNWMNAPAVSGSLAMFEVFMFIAFGMYTLLVTVRLTDCIVHERERQTLDSLLSLPITSDELLRAKFKGNVMRYWTWLIPVGLSLLILLGTGGGNLFGSLLLALAMAAHFAFFAMLGLFLSVIGRSRVSAYVSLAVILLLLLIGTAIAAAIFEQPGQSPWLSSGLNPVGCWLTIRNFWWRRASTNGLFEIGICLIGYGLAALALWLSAAWRFGRRAE